MSEWVGGALLLIVVMLLTYVLRTFTSRFDSIDKKLNSITSLETRQAVTEQRAADLKDMLTAYIQSRVIADAQLLRRREPEDK